jgi:hypothetical protein
MIRTGSQLTFCSPEKILRRTVVEQDDHQVITRIFSLDDGNVESSQTLFFDGIVSAEIISLKQNVRVETLINLLKGYQYLDLSGDIPSCRIQKTDKPLVVDFGTNSTENINILLPLIVPVISEFSIFDIIAGCTYYPSLLLGRTAGLEVNMKMSLILWENIDLIKKEITFSTCIREMNRFITT